MSIRKVILLCGVPGSGKSWVISQLHDKYLHVNHDAIPGNPKNALARQCRIAAQGNKDVIIDCPFAERELRDELIAQGLRVVPMFIVEPPNLVAKRYAQREGKPASQSTLTRALTIIDRANEWNAKMCTSTAMLLYLRELL